MTSELQGNVVDLCPVGRADLTALRLQGAAVGALEDRFDRRHGCARLHIRVDARGKEVMRILPRVNES